MSGALAAVSARLADPFQEGAKSARVDAVALHHGVNERIGQNVFERGLATELGHRSLPDCVAVLSLMK
jgi:hypothetical protein